MGMGRSAACNATASPSESAGRRCAEARREDLDLEFKRFEAPKLARVGNVVASFDNEPENQTFLAQFPGSISVLVDTQRANGAPPLDAGVQVIEDFTYV